MLEIDPRSRKENRSIWTIWSILFPAEIWDLAWTGLRNIWIIGIFNADCFSHCDSNYQRRIINVYFDSYNIIKYSVLQYKILSR